ncbi:hypothetical protein [Piscirickettsia litoralis]|uniref:Uncharacterized protein n=1 Tax=Piscirickettsia litoralis TaxID=1891921 RepID=A0ABX3A0S7_9GAMM|nr:hypothetical protein [Piscirickettsia litoralis]ODN42469.1 hypothetical protein BGC07_05425 [Piscirickettsia litoralis]
MAIEKQIIEIRKALENQKIQDLEEFVTSSEKSDNYGEKLLEKIDILASWEGWSRFKNRSDLAANFNEHILSALKNKDKDKLAVAIHFATSAGSLLDFF